MHDTVYNTTIGTVANILLLQNWKACNVVKEYPGEGAIIVVSNECSPANLSKVCVTITCAAIYICGQCACDMLVTVMVVLYVIIQVIKVRRRMDEELGFVDSNSNTLPLVDHEKVHLNTSTSSDLIYVCIYIRH